MDNVNDRRGGAKWLVLLALVGAGVYLVSWFASGDSTHTASDMAPTVQDDSATAPSTTAAVATTESVPTTAPPTTTAAPTVTSAAAPVTVQQLTIAQEMGSAEDLSTIDVFLAAADLDDMLGGAGPYTVFAPSNIRFAEMDKDLLNAISADQDRVRALARNHVIEGDVRSLRGLDGPLVTLAGTELILEEIDDELFIATSAGNTGSARSVHLHYDEHFPRGTRTPFGPWLSCIDGEVVQYPEALGYSDWRDVPYGSVVTNEGFECLDGVELTSNPPVLFAGVGQFGVAAPLDAIGSGFEVQLSSDTGGGTLVSELPVTRQSIRRIAATEGWTYSVRMRTRIGSLFTPWSDAITYDPASVGEVTTCLGFVATSEIGTDGPDVLIGTEGADEIAGGDGDDLICGMAGNDAIDGGAGNDFLDGDIGRDTLSGGPGNDRLWGRRGGDTLDGGSGRDRVSGGAGHDDASGGTGPDIVLGGVGHDIVRGSGGNDRLIGGNGDDAVFGGAGRDRLFGGAGTNPLDGGAGVDLCAEPGDSTVTKCED